MIPISAQDLIGSSHILYIDKNPEKCPICHKDISAELITSRITHSSSDGLLQAVFQCTNHSCERLFLANYTFSSEQSSPTKRIYRLGKISPVKLNDSFFSNKIKRISPNFVEVYNQALMADFINLTQLKGIGLLKAFELLVKDFAANESPDKVREIRKLPLGQCISEFLNEKIVRELTKKADWLESDESPLLRTWNKNEIKELELMIRLTANWIDYKISDEENPN